MPEANGKKRALAVRQTMQQDRQQLAGYSIANDHGVTMYVRSKLVSKL